MNKSQSQKGSTVKRLRLLPLLAAIAVLIVTAFTGSSAVASTAAPNQLPSLGLPEGNSW